MRLTCKKLRCHNAQMKVCKIGKGQFQGTYLEPVASIICATKLSRLKATK
jgi:hypothetical protein